MRNANPNHDEQYVVDDAWPVIEPTSAQECFDRLISLARSGEASAYHGAYKNWGCIRSSLDLHFDTHKLAHKRKPTAVERTAEETHLLESFARDADPHLSPEARRHIELDRLRWNTLRTTGTLYVGRHHGLPTRCVDWTSNELTGLFFACRRHFEENGIVWWMNNDCFTGVLGGQWPRVYGKKGNVEDDFERDFRDGIEKDVFIRLRYPPFMGRTCNQNAWITAAGRHDVRHDEAIFRLGVRTCGRIVVRASFKRELLNKLNRLGVSGSSLGLGDECVGLIAADVAQNSLHGSE